EGLTGKVTGEIRSGYHCGKASFCTQYDAPTLVQNYLLLAADRCNITHTTQPQNGTTKHIPGYIEQAYFVGAYVNRFNDSNGLDPRVACLYGLGFKDGHGVL